MSDSDSLRANYSCFLRCPTVPRIRLDNAVNVDYLLGLLVISLLVFALVGELDRQAVDVKIIADGDDDIQNKASMNTNSESKTSEHKCNLVHLISEGTGPAESKISLQDRSQGIKHSIKQRQGQDVVVGEPRLGEVCCDHQAYRVGVDQSDVEQEGNQMVVKDVRLQGEVRHDEHP